MTKQATKRRSHQLDKAIGARMRAVRLQRKLTQTQLGESLGVTFQQIQKYENGKNRVSGSAMVKVCEALNVKPEQLLGNGNGVFHSEPDVFDLVMTDKAMVRMVVEIARLPATQRKPVVSALVLMVRAFLQRGGKREAE